MYYFDPVEFGKRLAELRKENGLSQEAFGEKLNISPSFVKKLEAGNRCCSMDLLVELMNVFHVDVPYLLVGENYSSVVEKEKLLEAIDLLSSLIPKE